MKNLENYKIIVEWFELNHSSEDDLTDQKSFEDSVREYIRCFNALPLIGIKISNGHCDPGTVEEVSFNGVGKRIFIYINFE